MQTSAELVQSITHDVLAVPENTEQPGVGEKTTSKNIILSGVEL